MRLLQQWWTSDILARSECRWLVLRSRFVVAMISSEFVLTTMVLSRVQSAAAPLDHATGGGENNLAVNFELVVTDVDGDSSDPAIYSQSTLRMRFRPLEAARLKWLRAMILNGQFLTEEFAGADGAEIISFTYRNVTYTFDDVGTPITIDLIHVYDSNHLWPVSSSSG
ncbi:hypothetical protein O9992_20315 [Vibrio lentus]|nr:hypothetical protein [Vibrio lentus]